MENSRSRDLGCCPGGDAMFPSARYAMPPPPPSPCSMSPVPQHPPRRPYLQFPPPPPYPPPPDTCDGDCELADEDDGVSPTPSICVQDQQTMRNLSPSLHFQQSHMQRNPHLPHSQQPGTADRNQFYHFHHHSHTPPPAPPHHHQLRRQTPTNDNSNFHRHPINVTSECAEPVCGDRIHHHHHHHQHRLTPEMFLYPGCNSPTIEPCGNEVECPEYSYAYYEPGPPTSHTNPLAHSSKVGADTRGSRSGRHMYLTHYGTEENIYEEISEVAAKCSHLKNPDKGKHTASEASLSNILVEEEVRRVQCRHRKVLDELNLTVEAMLMPPAPSRDDDSSSNKGPAPDLLEDLLTVGPTDELLSPTESALTAAAPPASIIDQDSGFSSGTSYGFSTSSYASNNGSIRRQQQASAQSYPKGMITPSSTPYSPLLTRRSLGSGGKGGGASNYFKPKKTQDSPKTPKQKNQPQKEGSGSRFFGKKSWIRLPGFGNSSSGSSNNQVNKDEPRMQSGSWDEPGHMGTSENTRRLDQSQRTVSSEESWYSGSEQDLSSGDESEKSGNSSTKSNGQLKSTLNKAWTLCDKFRGGGKQPADSIIMDPLAAQGRLSRWFSIRRGSTNQYDVDSTDRISNNCGAGASKMPLLPEVEEESATTITHFPSAFQRRQQPPSLAPPPAGLTPQQLKRRHIVAAIVHSENSYVATLQRLVNDYKKPLEESNPPILSSAKIATLFHRLPEILQCHTLFRIALAESIKNWDRDEKIGDVFVASFSKAIVLDIYSGFINNFSVAMDLAKMEAKRKSALADFLKVKQISAHDRLSFFGLMVKPVQRFPQFIMFLQDLLKHTPQGHHDRMSLQLALTQLESLAEMLNERKREAEQFQAFKEMLRHISSKFSVRPLSDGNRYLLREDNVTQLEFNQAGMITKSKSRRLLLLNDLVVCVSVAPKTTDDFGSNERLSLKWSHHVTDIEVQDTSASPTLSRLLTAGMNKGSSIKSDRSSSSIEQSANSTCVDNLCAEMNNLMHDYEVVSRIADLVASLKGTYKELSVEGIRRILNSIQSSIQQRDEEMAWVDSCCLQLAVKNKSNREEIYTFQTDNPAVKKEWITELRLAQLALDQNNSPAWEVPEQERRPSTKMPLFVKAQPVYKSQHQTEVRCGCFYMTSSTKPTRQRSRNSNYLWVCTTDGASSHIAILAQQQQQAGILKDVSAFDLVETKVTAMEFVKGISNTSSSLAGDTVWMGTDSRRLLLYAASEPEKQEEVDSCTVPAVIVQIRYHCDSVFVALSNGNLLQYLRSPQDGSWCLKDPQTMSLGTDPVSSLLPININLYAACGKKVWVLSALTGDIQKNFSVQHEHMGNVNLMAHSGIGLWISLKNSSTICLYHTETFKHLQDINIASNVLRVTSPATSNSCNNRDCVNNNRTSVTVTALMACKGLLWVGTNVGIILTIPLPRLEGVPIISGRVNISYHAHFGPISFLLALQPKNTGVNYYSLKSQEEDGSEQKPKNEDEKVTKNEQVEENLKMKLEKQNSDTSVTSTVAAKLKHQLTSSPVVLRRRRHKEIDIIAHRTSKTLPRGLGSGGGFLSTSTTSSQGSGDTCDVYGLYGELMYIKDYDGEDGVADPIYESLRRSDPELAAIPGKVSTLDRRLRLKASRPRSLDLSNWSVDSRSSSLYTSSGSEETLSLQNGISRHGSNVSALIENAPSGIVQNTSDTLVTSSVQANETSSKSVTKNFNGASVDNSRRTVITLMGGRGYVNWRQACCNAPEGKTKHSSISSQEPNSNDAHIVIWEMKL